MVELLFLVCLATKPNTCSERSLVFLELTTLRCEANAQPELARWAAAHPAYRISRWRCRSVGAAQDA